MDFNYFAAQMVQEPAHPTFEAGYFGSLSREEVGELQKAMVAGSDINNPGASPGEGFAWRVEFLDNMLRYLSYKATDVKLFTALYKEQALNTVVEWNSVLDYGQEISGFMPEGGLPQEQDMTVARNYARIKYLATLRRMTDTMNLIRPSHGDVRRRAVEAATLWLMRAAEQACFFGDSRVVPLEWDGIRSQIEQARDGGQLANVFDFRGRVPSQNDLNDIVGTLMSDPNYGSPTHVHWSIATHQNFAKEYFPYQRIARDGSADQPVTLGVKVRDWQSSLQEQALILQPNVFIREGRVPSAAGLGAASNRPDAPQVTVQPTSPAASGAQVSQFYADDAGTYIYKVVGINYAGKSTPVSTNAIAVSVGDVVTFTIVDVTGRASGYEIFRTPVDGAAGTAKFMVRLPKGTSQTTVIVDENDDLPGTSTAFMLTQVQEAITFYQLLPMMLKPLADNDFSTRWGQALYGTLAVPAPQRHALLLNCGSAAPI